jgi:hypothetical protein
MWPWLGAAKACAAVAYAAATAGALIRRLSAPVPGSYSDPGASQ